MTFSQGKYMHLLKELSSLLGLAVVVVTLVGHLNSTFNTKESHDQLKSMVIENRKEIKRLKVGAKSSGAILCGIAIDLKLPTARKECHNIINN